MLWFISCNGSERLKLTFHMKIVFFFFSLLLTAIIDLILQKTINLRLTQKMHIFYHAVWDWTHLEIWNRNFNRTFWSSLCIWQCGKNTFWRFSSAINHIEWSVLVLFIFKLFININLCVIKWILIYLVMFENEMQSIVSHLIINIQQRWGLRWTWEFKEYNKNVGTYHWMA